MLCVSRRVLCVTNGRHWDTHNKYLVKNDKHYDAHNSHRDTNALLPATHKPYPDRHKRETKERERPRFRHDDGRTVRQLEREITR